MLSWFHWRCNFIAFNFAHYWTWIQKVTALHFEKKLGLWDNDSSSQFTVFFSRSIAAYEIMFCGNDAWRHPCHFKMMWVCAYKYVCSSYFLNTTQIPVVTTGCSLNIVFFSELCQFCCSAGFLPACVYTHWHRGKTKSGIYQNLRKKTQYLMQRCARI